MRRLLRDPLVACLLLGLALFALDRALDERDGERTVRVDASDVARLRAQWRAQTGSPPSDRELQALIDDHVREEILYREALRLGLDRDDTIVRRRLAQKLRFVTEDLAAGGQPTPEALRAYHETHRDRYVRPERVTFVHAYWSADRHKDASERARAALTQLTASADGTWRALGDPFLLHRNYAERSRDEVAQLFGAAFAEAVMQLPVGEWRAPVPSAYGAHAVRVDARQPARALSLDEARQDVLRDLQADRRREANRAYYAALREQYRVEVDAGALDADPGP